MLPKKEGRRAIFLVESLDIKRHIGKKIQAIMMLTLVFSLFCNNLLAFRDALEGLGCCQCWGAH
jgi:hypothetical protein